MEKTFETGGIPENSGFEQFMECVIMQLRRLGRIRTSETYMSALNSFRQFRGKEDTEFRMFGADLIMEYEAWLRSRGVTMNSVSFYMRILRAVYNRAIEKGLTSPTMPFRHVYTGVDRTAKRAVSLNAIKRIKELELTRPGILLARDLFLFSFYTRGMSFVDIAYLKKHNLKNGFLTYRRRKTGQQLLIKWERCMQEIIDRHPTGDSEYLLPVIVSPENERTQYLNKLRYVNNHLKRIGIMARLPVSLSFYCARHSWASAAKNSNIPIAVISEGMGHESQHTTQIYLTSLDNASIDRANSLILRKI